PMPEVPTPTASLAPPPLEPAVPAPSAEAPDPSLEDSEPPAPEAPAEATPEKAGGGGEFDRAVALRALAESSKAAARCRMAGAPPGAVRVSVIFAPSGSVENVQVTNAPYAGTPTSTCIREKLQTTRIDGFSGGSQTVVTSVQVY
nr:hypothetical protein [Polyangiaceae bacterium]